MRLMAILKNIFWPRGKAVHDKRAPPDNVVVYPLLEEKRLALAEMQRAKHRHRSSSGELLRVLTDKLQGQEEERNRR